MLCRWPVKPDRAELWEVAAATPGFAGADLKALCGGAAIQAARRALKGTGRAANAALLVQLQVMSLLWLGLDGPSWGIESTSPGDLMGLC